MGDRYSMLELQWLSRQTTPVWGGVLAAIRAGERITDGDIPDWLERGIIKIEGDGFVITAKGLSVIHAAVCPTCGQKLPQ